LAHHILIHHITYALTDGLILIAVCGLLVPLYIRHSNTIVIGMGNGGICRLIGVWGESLHGVSGVPRNFFQGGGSTNSVEDREDGDLGAVAP